jgi:hypothetical protein
MSVNPEHLARIMFKARCEEIGCSELDAAYASGDDHHQYMEFAEPLAELVNEYDVEARAVARYILDRVNLSSIEAISVPYSPPNRVLP